MLETRIRVKADLDKGIKKTYLDALFATKDNEAHQIDVQLFRGQAQAQVDNGAAVSGYFIRYSDNATVPIEGSVSGNIASVTLTKACYNKPGQFALIIKVLIDDVVSTVFYGEGSIFNSSTDTYVDEENVIPSLEDLLAQVAVMESGTKAANTAASSANTAAVTANTAAVKANVAAENANTAAGNANTAAGNANASAAKIDGMTVSASASTTAGATISENNGVKHIAFKIPKGETGATPDITFEVETGAAGSDVLIDQSGTAEAPHIKLTIPRGDTGSVDGIDYYEGTPAALGTASPGTANGVARGNHVHPMPSAADVGARPSTWMPSAADVGARPNTWMPSAADVGALPNGGTAADSNKLGGVTADKYALKTDIPENTGGSDPLDKFVIGCIYHFAIDINPPEKYGGDWEQIKGRFLIGTGAPTANDNGTSPGSYNYALGSKNGAASKTIGQNHLPQHSHPVTVTGSKISWETGYTAGGSTFGLKVGSTGTNVAIASYNETTNTPLDIMPPWEAVNIWKRVA